MIIILGWAVYCGSDGFPKFEKSYREKNFKWSCCLSPSLENGILYTFDVEQENDLTFEMSLLEQSSLQEIHAYNPNIVKPESTDDTFIFHKIALDTESNEKLSKDGRNKSRRWRRQTFSEIRTSLNHITVIIKCLKYKFWLIIS